MFFWGNSKLEEKIKEKDEEISILHLAIEELNQEHTDKLKDDAKELKALNNKLEKIKSADALIGAYDRRYFYDVAECIISLAKRERQHLSLARIYIDQLKDTKADEVLQTLTLEATKHIRESDVFVKFEDKEFVILFPNTSLEQAMIISEKLRKAIESCYTINNVKSTISIGVSEFIHGKDNVDMALKRAYKALEKAKGNTKNKVVLETKEV